jgi:hypothetical protein
MDANNAKIPLSYIFNSVIEQAAKIEKIKTQNILSIFDNHTIYQSKLGKNCFGHFICDEKTFNYAITKDIVKLFQERIRSIENDLEKLTQSIENN